MKILRTTAVALLATATALAANAQNAGDLLRFSQYNYSFSTARSAAMGGAFTSLGADLSTMSINPAGLGMYRGSEMGFTPSVTIGSMKTTYGSKVTDNKTKFSVGNFGAALNLYQGTGALTSYSLGIGYNKLVDFNTSSMARTNGSELSMLDYFTHTIQGLDKDLIGQFPGGFNKTDLYQWGGVLGYQTNLIDDIGSTQYSPTIGQGTRVNRMIHTATKGSVGEYTLSAGLNFQNIFYFGATVGLQDVYYESNNTLYEDVDNAAENLNGYSYRQTLIMSGTGVNAKFGITLRPIPNLRIGAAVHTPTYTNIEDKYIENMTSSFKNSATNRSYDSPAMVNKYNINSATRLLTGISYTFPIGVITADYERVWYNGMRIKETGDWQFEEEVRADVKEVYQAGNNFRAGIEITPTPGLYLRAGYANYGSPMKHDNLIGLNRADVTSYTDYSGGIGYRFGGIAFDLAYVNTNYKYTDYELFRPFTIPGANAPTESGLISTKQSRNTIILSVSARF